MQAGSVIARVGPPEKAGVVVRFDVTRGKAAVVVLVDPSGKVLPVGATVVTNGGATTVVGFDGETVFAGSVAGERGGSDHAQYRPEHGDLPRAFQLRSRAWHDAARVSAADLSMKPPIKLAVKRIVRALLVCLAWPICSPAIGAGAPPTSSVVATGLNFGIYRATAGPVAFTGTIHVLCSGGPAMFTVALTGGSSGSVTTRQMRASNGAVLRYQLYLDAARTQPWGDGASRPGRRTDHRNRRDADHLYGLLFSGQHAPAGQVTDTVQAILNY